MQHNFDAIFIGGGAAGYFAALAASEASPERNFAILDAGSQTLSKVAISGGGRCNVTHSRFNINDATKAYPRGSKELKSAFSRFQAKDTISWFNKRGVALKTESDGRVFPTSDSSQTIIDCLNEATNKAGIKVFKKTKVRSICKAGELFTCHCSNGDTFLSPCVLLASGGARQGHQLATSLGHNIIDPVPSLFTFNITDPRIAELSGVSVQKAKLSISIPDRKKIVSEGPLLITHWGLSGPAVLKLSAWGARELSASAYQAKLNVNWFEENTESLLKEIQELKNRSPKKSLGTIAPSDVPKRLWLSILKYLEVPPGQIWGELPKKMCSKICEELTNGTFYIQGKGVFKDEFVTCGGVELKELDFRTMESKLIPGLYFAGEVLDIDGLTGGYNFQAAWTTGHIAGSSIGQHLK